MYLKFIFLFNFSSMMNCPLNIFGPLFLLSICLCFDNPSICVLHAANNASHPGPSSRPTFSPFSFNFGSPTRRRQISNVAALPLSSSAQNYSSQNSFIRGKETLSTSSTATKRNKVFKVTAQKGFPERGKSRFNYENQLEIMLGNELNGVKQRILLNRTLLRPADQHQQQVHSPHPPPMKSTPKSSPSGARLPKCIHCADWLTNIPYNVLAIRAAKAEVENFGKHYRSVIKEGEKDYNEEGREIGCHYIMTIAKAMLDAINFYNSNSTMAKMANRGDQEAVPQTMDCRPSAAVEADGAEQEEEQLRFVGLVLWHLVFRSCPIVDRQRGDEFVFFAKTEPDIDAIDPTVASTLCAELDDELAQKGKKMRDEEKRKLSAEMQKEFEKEFEQLQRLEEKMPSWKKQLENVEVEKYNELHEKFDLLRTEWGWQKGKKLDTKMPFYDQIDRAFIAYGREASALIVIVRALLAGAIYWEDFTEYVTAPTETTLRVTKDKEQLSQMLRKLVNISTLYGF